MQEGDLFESVDRRVFLGWDRPFLDLVVDWLLGRGEGLAGSLVVVPTAQSGRRLRERLAEVGAGLAPRVVTPAFFLETGATAPVGVELVAWVEVLESVTDWEEFAGAFPRPPGEGEERGWALALARSLVDLRRQLQEAGLTIAMAAGRLRDGIEGERWEALASLEKQAERTLRGWGWRSRSTALADDPYELPGQVESLVVAGVTDPWPVVIRRWEQVRVPVTVLVAAPDGDSLGSWGEPEGSWAERPFAWPHGFGSVQVAADARQQAEMAREVVARGGESSCDVALGSADEEVSGELVRVFSRSGWQLFDPGGAGAHPGLGMWFSIWRRWLASPRLNVVADLLQRSESGILTRGRRAQKARTLTEVRDQWLVMESGDLRRLLDGHVLREKVREQVEELAAAVDALEGWRDQFRRVGFSEGMSALVPLLARTSERAAEEAEGILEFVDEIRDLESRVQRDPGFWLEVMQASLSERRLSPPEGRVLDVLGWLELPFEPGKHLVIGGMNEGRVPGRSGGEPWLGEQVRERLGLMTEERRVARDAFLLHSMVSARREGGRVDLICGRTSSSGDVLLPSRLLLAAPRDELPERVDNLFREVEPPDAGLQWTADFRWAPPQVAPPERISVTAFRDYLACPFRFYLKHVVRMQSREPDRGEWNMRDFGTILHEVLERWGRDEEVRDYSKREALEGWLHNELDRLLVARFGESLPLAVEIQVEGMRQRLGWFARQQACERATGWMVEAVETSAEFKVAGMTVTGKIDRIDRHADGRWRVLDYKSGRVESVDRAHWVRVTASTRHPDHLAGEERLVHEKIQEKGKSQTFAWRNLQLPLYLVALRGEGSSTGPFPEAGYFQIGTTEAAVQVNCWSGLEEEDLQSALRCAELVVERVQGGSFWPPVARTTYDDYEQLAMGRSLAQVVEEPADWKA